MTDFRIRRIYDDPTEGDGWRVLIDRLWPRGVSKERAELDVWAKELSPSAELRKWFNHTPELFDEFEQRYRAELDASDEAARAAEELHDHAVVTLLYSAHDTENNNAVVLRRWLQERN